MSQKAQMPIPNDWDGESQFCVCIAWPDSAQWYGVLQGVLTSMTRGRFWDGETGNIKDAQQIGWDIWEANKGMEPCGGTGECETCIIIDEFGVQWIDVNGDGVGDVEVYNPPEDASPREEIPFGDGSSRACIIAAGIIEMLRDAVEMYRAQVQGVATLIEACTAFMAVLTLVCPPIGGAVALAAFVAVCLEYSLAEIDAGLDEDFLDELMCEIFAELDNDGEVSQEELERIVARVRSAYDGVQEDFTAGWLASAGRVGLQNAATMYSIETADCAECEDCPAVECGVATTWEFDGVPLTGYLPVDGRQLTVIGGLYYGARWELREDYRSHCGTGYWGFCIEFENMVIEGGGDCDMELTNVAGGKTEVLMSSLIGQRICVRKIEKLTEGVTDDQIITGTVRIVPCIDSACPELT